MLELLKPIFKRILGREDPWNSLTNWGLLVWAAGDSIVGFVCGPEFMGNFGENVCNAANQYHETVGGVLTAIGIRRRL